MMPMLSSDSSVEDGDPAAAITNLPGRSALRTDTSAAKALALLDAFTGSRALLGVTELAARAGVPKSTAHRLLTVLVESGYVRRVDNRYCLGERTFVIGNGVRACKPNGLKDRAMPYLTELYAQSREVVHLGIHSGVSVLYLEKLFGHGAPPLSTSVGARKPAYATALGKSLLAFCDGAALDANLGIRFERFTPYTLSPVRLANSLRQIREDHLATDNEEYQRGLSCVASPIFDTRTGRAIAAVSLSYRSSEHNDRRYRRLVTETAQGISAAYSTGPRPAAKP